MPKSPDHIPWTLALDSNLDLKPPPRLRALCTFLRARRVAGGEKKENRSSKKRWPSSLSFSRQSQCRKQRTYRRPKLNKSYLFIVLSAAAVRSCTKPSVGKFNKPMLNL